MACGTGELAGELARLAAAEIIADGDVPGIETTAGKGGFDSLAGETALKQRFGMATLDGLGAPTRAELEGRGATFEGEVQEQRWGTTIQLRIPGAGTLTLYQPKYDPPALGHPDLDSMW